MCCERAASTKKYRPHSDSVSADWSGTRSTVSIDYTLCLTTKRRMSFYFDSLSARLNQKIAGQDL